MAGYCRDKPEEPRKAPMAELRASSKGQPGTWAVPLGTELRALRSLFLRVLFDLQRVCARRFFGRKARIYRMATTWEKSAALPEVLGDRIRFQPFDSTCASTRLLVVGSQLLEGHRKERIGRKDCLPNRHFQPTHLRRKPSLLLRMPKLNPTATMGGSLTRICVR